MLLLTAASLIVLFAGYVLWVLIDGIVTLVSRRKIEAQRYRAKQAITLVVQSRTDHTEQLFTVTLAEPKGKKLPAFLAGQYLTLLSPSSNNLKPESRRYSLAHWQPKPSEYHLGIRQVNDGKISSWLQQHLQTGQYIDVLPPAGHFTLHDAMADSNTTDIVLIGAGIGITPVAAMLDTLMHQNKRVHLFHSAKNKNELLWFDKFNALSQSTKWFKYHPYLSNPDSSWSGFSGRISANNLIQTEMKLNSTHFFMCAKLEMMLEMQDALILQGVPLSHIHWESFGLGGPNADQQSYQVNIDRIGSYTFSGESSLLQAMESWNVPINADCRAGECGECQIKILNGQCKAIQPTTCVTEPNKMLACCVVPTSDLTISI